MTDNPGRDGPWLEDAQGNRIEVDGDDEVARAFRAALESGDYESQPPLTLWWSLRLPGGGGVHMKVQDTGTGGSWVVTDVYMHAPEVTTTLLRGTPLSQLDLIMNLVGGFDPDTIAEAHQEMGQQVISDPDSEPTLAELRHLAETAPAELPTPPVAERPRLTRPDGTNPDGFYTLVGAAYREYALQSHAPAIEIANEAGVPVATARTWVREARRRGKLPTGTRGKAG